MLAMKIRRQASTCSESQWAHWRMLMAPDRVNVVEGLVDDLGRSRIPNVSGADGRRAGGVSLRAYGSRLSQSRSFVQRGFRVPPRTATATALRCPSSTTSRLPRVTPV